MTLMTIRQLLFILLNGDQDVSRKFQIHVLTYMYSCILGLTDFLYSLDERYQAKVSKEGKVMARKARKLGSVSACDPPYDAPDWTKQG